LREIDLARTNYNRRAKRFALTLVLFLAACSGSSSAPSRAPSEHDPAETASPATDAEFWAWFRAHAGELARIQSGEDPMMDQIEQALDRIDKRLAFEIGPLGSKGARTKELIISAQGAREVFPVVQRMVAAAPAIDGWRVIALRPRQTGFAIQFGGTQLAAGDLRFRIGSSPQPGQPLDVSIYVKGAAVDDNTRYAVYLLLDATLGEYDVATQLGGIDMRPESDAPRDARPLTELAAIVDARK
jgi:hypothetical protein